MRLVKSGSNIIKVGNSMMGAPDAVAESVAYVTDGLILMYDAGDTNSYPGSGTDIFDISSQSNNGILYNGASYNADGGGSIYMAGDDDYIGCGSGANLAGSTEFSVEIWVKRFATGNVAQIGAYSNATPTRYGWFVQWWSDNSLYFGVRNGGTNYLRYSIPFTTEYRQIVAVFGNEPTYHGRVYVNGVESSIVGGSGSLETVVPLLNTPELRIGGLVNYATYDRAYHAIARIYTKALSQPEIEQNFDAHKERFGLA